MYNSWVVPHEVQSEALNVWWHLAEFYCAEERDQWLVVCFHSEVKAQNIVTEPFRAQVTASASFSMTA